MEHSKKRMSPTVMIILAILGVCAIFLVLPSSKTARVRKAQARLEGEFKGPTTTQMQPLMNADLVSAYAIEKIPSGKESIVHIFAPTPTDKTIQNYIGELGSPMTYYPMENVKSLVLMAPDPASPEWSLFGKIWIAKVLQKDQTNDLRSLGSSIAYSTAGSSLTRLKTIWAAVPASIQKQAEDMVARNREIAKSCGGSRRLFFTGTGAIYEIGMSNDMYSFFNDYVEVNPNRRAAR